MNGFLCFSADGQFGDICMCQCGWRSRSQSYGTCPKKSIFGHKELHRGSSRNGGRERKIGELVFLSLTKRSLALSDKVLFLFELILNCIHSLKPARQNRYNCKIQKGVRYSMYSMAARSECNTMY